MSKERLVRKDLYKIKVQDLSEDELAIYELFCQVLEGIYQKEVHLGKGKMLLDFLLQSESERERTSELMEKELVITIQEAADNLMKKEEWQEMSKRGIDMMNKLIAKNPVRIVRLTQEIRDYPAELKELEQKQADPKIQVTEYQELERSIQDVKQKIEEIQKESGKKPSEISCKEFTGRFFISIVIETGKTQIF